MRKHFLLLFLMALLPLAGWATDVTVTLYDFTVPYGTEITVDNLPTDARQVTGATWAQIKDYLQFSGPSATTGVGTYDYTLTKTATTGTYTIFLSSNNAKMTITKATNSWTTEPAVVSTQDYDDGNALNLLETVGAAKFGTVEYSKDGGTNWTTEPPTAADAGIYSVKARVEGTKNYTALERTVGNATIVGAPITVFTKPAAKADLEYTGAAQPLITAGSSTQGKLMYKVGTGDYSENIPTGTNKGNYTVTWYIKGDNQHSDKAEETINVSIGKGTPTITTAPALVAGFTYDGTVHEIISTNGVATLSADITYQLKKQNGENWDNVGGTTTNPATLKIKDAGVYKVEYSVVANDNVNAVAAASTATMTVAQAPLTVSIKGCSKIYDDADPAFEVVYNGFVNNEGADVDALVTAGEFTKPVAGRDAGSDVGYYALTFTTHAAARNYKITEDTSNFLLINPKPLGEVTIVLGEAPTYDGNEKEANITSVSFNGGVRTLYNAGTGLGDYTVTYDGETNINAGVNTAKLFINGKNNYTGTVEKTFTIGGAALYIIPTAASKTYGANDPTEFAYTLKVGDETVDNNTLNGKVTLARVAGENVGTYKIYVVNYKPGVGDNYVPANVLDNPNSLDAGNKTALFTINAVENNVLKLKFDPNIADNKKTKVYGDANPAWDINDLVYDEEGLIGNDTWDVLKYNIGTPVFTLASTNAGETTVSVSGLGSPNYPTVEVEPLVFTVTKKQLKVAVENQTLDYGDAIASVEGVNWHLTGGSDYAAGESNAQAGIVLYTEQNINLFAPESSTTEAIKAKIEGNSNYEIAASGNTWGTLNINASVSLVLGIGDDLAKITAYNGQTKPVSINFGVDTRAARKYSDSEADGQYNWIAEKWTTLVLPFDITVAELSQKFNYAIVNVINPSATTIDGTSSKFYGRMTMKGDLNTAKAFIPANTPILLKIADDLANINKGVINFGSKKIIAPADEKDLTVNAGAGSKFVGTYTKRTVTKNDGAKVWFMNGNEDGWQYIGSESNASWDILPFEAYIDFSALQSAPENLTFFFEDLNGFTAIKNVNTENRNGKLNAEGWYTLDGVKLQDAPVKKGLYIKNGKKVVIK